MGWCLVINNHISSLQLVSQVCLSLYSVIQSIYKANSPHYAVCFNCLYHTEHEQKESCLKV